MIDYSSYMRESLFNHLGNALFVAVVFSVMLAEVRQYIQLEKKVKNPYVKILLFFVSYFLSMSIGLILLIGLVSFMYLISIIVG